jgi:hypothetical protein
MAFHKKPRKTSSVYKLTDILHATIKVIGDRGEYVSKKASDASDKLGPPTTQFVLQILNDPDLLKTAILTTSKENVAEIVSYFSLPPRTTDEFSQTVYSLFGTGMVTERMVGYIVALPWMYKNLSCRASKLIKIADKYSSSNYMGQLGVRDSFFVKLVEVIQITKPNEEGMPETFFIYKVADQIGNFGLFFSKQPPADSDFKTVVEHLPIKVWDCFEMRATPKKMEPNKETGIKETQFSRIRIVDVIGQGTEE